MVVWALLFLNVLAYSGKSAVIPMPHRIGQLLTQGALPAALILALSINRRGVLRSNWFLALYSLLATTSLMMSVRLIGLGTEYRAFRLVAFVAILWLLTPWWRDRSLVLLRGQLTVLYAILVSLAIGIVVAPHKSFAINFGSHRLNDAVWPIPATQVGHYMAELTGLTVLLWMAGMISRRHALLVGSLGFAALLASHTRTALIGLFAGLLVAGLSLFATKRRVRLAFLAVLIAVVAVVLPLSPLLNRWLIRGQSSAQVSNLSGRKSTWSLVLTAPRPETNEIFGSGLSNGGVIDQAAPSANGLPIDGSWIATFQDQGIVGMVLDALIFLVLILTALLRPRGPTRAFALFLIVYCLFASFTETGMGEASPYLLDLTVAASLLVPRSAAKPIKDMISSINRRRARSRRSATRPVPTPYLPVLPILSPVGTIQVPVEPDFFGQPDTNDLIGTDDAGLDPPLAAGTQIGALWRSALRLIRRLGWGVADQGMSSITNFALSLYIARELGAVRYGAFAFAYVTYSFAINASQRSGDRPTVGQV